ncbi:MAG: LytTR family transcriptional regulator DNA-binding domain-containing protein [Bacteroidales bacterium]|jgi:DNA-binding LytR/AlgR family response regulator|nr:LytTR family transcriptional regulator DNA-binding domain-containing protein [Bacteroidales bacterium]
MDMATLRILLLHVLIALTAFIALYFSIKPLMLDSGDYLAVDSLIAAVLASGLLFLMGMAVEFGRFSALSSHLRWLVYVSLAALFMVCWLGMEWLLMYAIFSSEDWWQSLLPTIPIRILLAVLIYCLAALIYMHHSIYRKAFESQGFDTVTENMQLAAEPLLPLVSENEKPIPLERIAVKNGQKVDVIPVADIVYLQAEGDYVRIFTEKGKFLKEQTMKSFESQLPPDKFVRVHRSSIINVDYIAQIELYDKQNQLLKLKTGISVKISLSGYKILKEALGL